MKDVVSVIFLNPKLLTNPSAILLGIVVLPIGLFLLWLTRWPKPRPVKAQRAVKFRPSAIPDNIDTIVIGSGSGGCTCANLLAQSGQRVLLLEQHDKTGGCTHTFREQNCEFDSGLHYTSKAMSQPTSRPGAIMDFMSRGKQEWIPLDDPYDEVIYPVSEDNDDDNTNGNRRRTGRSYKFVSGVNETMKSLLDELHPTNNDERTDLERKIQHWTTLCRITHNGFVALAISRLLPSYLLPSSLRRRIDNLMTIASLTVRDVQHAIFNLGYTPTTILESNRRNRRAILPVAPPHPDPHPTLRRLKGVLAHPIGDYAVQPRNATMAAHGVTFCHYANGGSYTIGPTQNISTRNSSVVRSYGGQVLCDATVTEIVVEKGRAVGVRVVNTSDLSPVEDDKGKTPFVPRRRCIEIRATNIVCATSIYNLYNRLLPPTLPVVKQFGSPAMRSVRQSTGHVFLFCKIEGDAATLNLPTHNLWYFHKYDLDQAFDEYFKNPTEVRPPTVYVGFPCTKDPTWRTRFPGVSNCILISDGLYEWFERWADKDSDERTDGTKATPRRRNIPSYDAFKYKLTEHLLDILYDVVPQVRGKILHRELGTPLSECSYLSSFRGGSYGTRCTTDMFDVINRRWTTTPRTEVPGLYLAGSDAFLPSVVGAMYGGCLGACAVLGYGGSLRLGHALLCHLAGRLREEDKRLGMVRSYVMAIEKFIGD